MKIMKIFFATLALLVTLLPATLVFAATCVESGPFGSGQICYNPLTTIPGITQINGSGGKTVDGSDNPAAMVTSFYKFAIGIASVGAVIMIMWGGFEYMTTEAFTGKSNAKNRITYALVGLILLLSSYIILRTINKDLVTFKVTLPQGNKFLSDAAAKEIAAQQRIDDITSTTAAINREINVKRQAMLQDQAVLDGLKKELADNKDPEKAKAIQKQIDDAQQTFNQSEKSFNETVVAGQKKVSDSGIAAYMDAGDYARALTYTSMQEKATARELEMLKNDPVNGSTALNKKLSDVDSEIKKINEDKTLSDEQKQEKVKTLTEQKELTTKSITENEKKVADVKAEAEKNEFNKVLISNVATNTAIPDVPWWDTSTPETSPLQALLLKGSNQQGGVPAVDARIDTYMNTAEQKAKEYESQGRIDLAKSVRETAEAGKQTMIKQINNTMATKWGEESCKTAVKDSKYLSSVSCKS